MTSRLKDEGSRIRSMLNVSLPLEEHEAHFLVIGLTWTSFGSTPIRLAHASTSALNRSTGTASSRDLVPRPFYL